MRCVPRARRGSRGSAPKQLGKGLGSAVQRLPLKKIVRQTPEIIPSCLATSEPAVGLIVPQACCKLADLYSTSAQQVSFLSQAYGFPAVVAGSDILYFFGVTLPLLKQLPFSQPTSCKLLKDRKGLKSTAGLPGIFHLSVGPCQHARQQTPLCLELDSASAV